MAGSNGSTFSTQAANTPTVQTGATALAKNPARIAFMIQNQGTNVLYVLLGAGASTTVYHNTLKACTVAGDGTGGAIAMEAGTVYNGIITVAGTSPSYTVLEIAP
jgi:tagatose-1,6-bisphosphate aldolase